MRLKLSARAAFALAATLLVPSFGCASDPDPAQPGIVTADNVVHSERENLDDKFDVQRPSTVNNRPLRDGNNHHVTSTNSVTVFIFFYSHNTADNQTCCY